jgi:hypothetical protein
LFGSGIDPFNIIELLLNINADTAREGAEDTLRSTPGRYAASFSVSDQRVRALR